MPSAPHQLQKATLQSPAHQTASLKWLYIHKCCNDLEGFNWERDVITQHLQLIALEQSATIPSVSAVTLAGSFLKGTCCLKVKRLNKKGKIEVRLNQTELLFFWLYLFFLHLVKCVTIKVMGSLCNYPLIGTSRVPFLFLCALLAWESHLSGSHFLLSSCSSEPSGLLTSRLGIRQHLIFARVTCPDAKRLAQSCYLAIQIIRVIRDLPRRTVSC